MKTLTRHIHALIVLIGLLAPIAQAQTTAFTYQGRLNDGGSPANGSYDLQFALFDALTGGAQSGDTLTNAATAVSNGLFTVSLDFGNAPFNGSNRWLELAVRTNGGGAFGPLTPRQPITPTPYALYALTPSGTNGLNGLNGTNGLDGATGPQGPIGLTGPQGIPGLNGTNGLDGATGPQGPAGPLLPNVALIDTNQIFTGTNNFSGVVQATNENNQFTGSFTGDGGGLTNVTASSVAAANITGTIGAAQLPASVVTNGASGLNLSGNLSGSFSGNGAGITGVDLRNVNGQGALSFTTNNGVFVLASSPGVGLYPEAVTSADVNGDGKADLISANEGPDTLTVLTNNGSGVFVLASSPAVGLNPWSVTSADVNGDGKADLISANISAHTLTVLTNNGSSGFVLASSPAVGTAPRSVTAADVNGDGKPDLISANINASTLTVLTNNGSGVFVLASSPGVGSAPHSVTSADVNGDGKADLISANLNANTLTVLTNIGSGVFVLASSPAAGSGPISVTSADVNGDGQADLISANVSASTLTVLTNNGSGGFVLASSPAVGSNPESVTSADVNGDGKADLISANGGASTLTVLTNNGSGGFVPASSPGVGVTPRSVTSADVNGDGKADLISANFGDSTLTVLFNTTTIPASFAGNGSGLTNLSAANITSGTVADARLSANVSLLGNSIESAEITDGTIVNADISASAAIVDSKLAPIATPGKVSDSALSANVARRTGGNNFTGSQTFSSGGIDVSDQSKFFGPVYIYNGIVAGVSPLAIAGNTHFLNNVGIGTPSPTQAKLVVIGSVASGNFNASYLAFGGGSFPVVGHGSHPISIYADGDVQALGFYALSDERIKSIRGQSDRAADLQTLLGIQVTDYTYKDTVAKGSRPQKKVIAQQVEAVYPQAVNQSTDVVPDIFQKAAQKDGWVQLATDLKVGERVKLIGEKEEGIHEVLEVRKDAFRTAFKPATEKVFVYGREVKDFRSVDYEAISMLNVSATQELARQVKAQETKLNAQEEELNALRAEKAALADKLARIEKAVAQLTAESKSAKLAGKSTPSTPPTAAVRKTLTTASAKD